MGQHHRTAVDDVGDPPTLSSVPTHDLALLTSPEVYRTVARQSAVAMFLVAPDGRFVVANPAACDLFGRSEEELFSLSLADVSHPDDLEWSGAQLSRAIDEGTSAYRIQKRYLRPDGSAVAADVTVSLLRDEHGRPLGFFASAVDDTARLEAARRADAASELLRASMDSLLDPWVLLRAVRDVDGTITDFVYVEANKEACRHNAMSHRDLIGRRLLDLLPGHRGQLLADYAWVLESGEPLIHDDLPFVTDGEVRWFDNRAVRVGDDDLSFTWRDVTDNHTLRGDLARRATTDPLTGLYNRAGLAEAVARMSSPERRTGPAGMAALYLDLDGLNTINNRYGHPAGDAVLRAVGDRIAGALRATDVVARVGGDEFVVLAPGVGNGVADSLAVKIAQAVTRPVRVEGAAIVPTISVGVCVGSDDIGIDELIARADASLLERKRRLYDAPEGGA